MFNQYPPQLARLLNEERISEARRAMRGFCCADDRRDLTKSGAQPSAPANQAETCAC